MVEFIHGVVALLAGLILVLTALVGWLYLQQSRMSHAINALAVAVTAPPPSFMYSELPAHGEPSGEPSGEAAEPELAEAQPGGGGDEDRLSVHDIDAPAETPAETPAEAPVATVEDGGAEDSADAVAGKTVSQLREMLTAKGIPFNKSDKKPTLISLIQVSSPA